MNRAKDLLNKPTLYTLYCSFILPYLDYCIEIWGNSYKTNTLPAYSLQKRAIRIASKAGYRDHTNQYFVKFKTLKFYDLVDYKTLQFMYKAYKNTLPAEIQGFFKPRRTTHSLRGLHFFSKPIVRTDLKLHCLSCKGVSLWNAASAQLKNCTSLNQRKILLKKLIYSNPTK